MATEVGVGYISIVPDVKGFAAAMQRETGTSITAMGGLGKSADDTGKKVSKAHSAMGTAAKVAGVAMATAGVVTYLKGTISAAEDAATSQAKLSGVMTSMGFGQYTSQVQSYANALGNKIAVDNDDIAKTQAKIATFAELGKTAGDVGGYFNRVTEAAYDMEALGFAPAEQGAIMLAKAMNSPEQAAALSRTGALTKAEAEHAAELAKSGRAEEARAFIMAAVEKQVSGSAEKNVTSSQKMEVALGKIAEVIGTALLPIVDILANAFGVLGTWMSENSETMAIIAPIILAIAVALGIAAIAQWAMNSALLASPITWIILGIVALVAAVIWLWTNVDSIKNFLSAAWDWIKNTAIAAFDALKAYWATMWQFYLNIATAIWNAITGFLTAIWNGIKAVFTAVFDAIKAYWSFMWNAIKTVVTTIWNAITALVTAQINLIKSVITTAINTVKSVITGALNIVKNVWSSTFGTMKNVITSTFTAISGVVNRIVAAIQGAIDKIKAAIASVSSSLASVPVLGSVMNLAGFADGGLIPGRGNRDSQVIATMPGEYVLNRQMVGQAGVSSLESWRQGGPPPGGRGITVQNLNVNNPVAEPASDSLPRAMRQLAYVGVGA